MCACFIKQTGAVDGLRGLLSRAGAAEIFEKVSQYVFKE